MKTRTQFSPFLRLSLFTAASLVMVSCVGPRPLRGGQAMTARSGREAFRQSLSQGENPAQPSRQDQQTITTRTYTVPAGSRLEQVCSPTVSALPHTNAAIVSVLLSTPMPVVEREETRAATQLGASQKDTARELGAKLSNLRAITWVGAGLFILGLASLVWPPLKAIVGSVTTSAALTLGGLALLVLPTLIVGNEVFILGGVALTAGAWFLAHRHGRLRGLLGSYSAAPARESSPPSPLKTQD